MTKKLILLTLALPMVLMIALFSATKTVSYAIGVSVSSVEIIEENKIIYLDLDTRETYKLDFAVYPTAAENKTVTVSTEPLATVPLADLGFELSSEGSFTVTPKSTGAAKVYITTADGGYRDSVIIYVESNTLKSIECSVSSDSLFVGESTTVSTVFLPEKPSNTILHFESSDTSVVTVDQNGTITAVGKGEAKITVISDADANIRQTINISVYNRDALDIAYSEVTLWNAEGALPLSVDVNEGDSYSIACEVIDASGNPTSVLETAFDYSGTNVSLIYSFKDDSFVGTLTVKVTMTASTGASVTKDCKITRIKQLTASFTKELDSVYAGANSYLPFTLTPSDASVSYEVFVSNANLTAEMKGSRLTVVGKMAGTATVTLKITSTEHPEQFTEITTEVVVIPRRVEVVESGSTYGIENILTIGKYNSDGTLASFRLNYSTSAEEGDGFADCISWVSLDPDNVTITNDGYIEFKNNTFKGIVEFYAKFSYGGFETSSEKFRVRCISDGVNVYTYEDLITATEAQKPVILRASIKEDFGYIGNEFNPSITVVETTYDKTYYENIGQAGNAKIKILIQFRNDVYGNGFTINSDNVSSNTAYFNGPLNFVAASESGTGGLISVKAQDNVSFAIYEGVTVCNIELQGYDFGDNAQNHELSDLDYVGTVAEVFGDNVSIEYSRISNGRTVLRIFGDEITPSKVIRVNIKNCVLSRAREFILRMGSNCFVDGDTYLQGDNAQDKKYNTKIEYKDLSKTEKDAYDNAFIKTFVNVKNCVFENAGIFAVGIDSHFSGALLEDGRDNQTFGQYLTHWYDLAKTSYGAKLTVEEDVRFYNWNKVDNISSDTLIEITGNNDTFKKMALDIKAMINAAASSETNKNIVYKIGEDDYVHAGIAFFGGGKNYGIAEFKNYTSHTLNGYIIDLKDANRAELKAAAGNESFYFLLADSTGSFKPENQAAILASGDEAYSCIYK